MSPKKGKREKSKKGGVIPKWDSDRVKAADKSMGFA